MAMHAISFNTMLAVNWAEITGAFGVPAPKCPFRIEEIEQVSATLGFGCFTTDKGEKMRRISLHCLVIKTVNPFDWPGYLRSRWPDLIKATEGGRAYYKLKPRTAPQIAKAPAFLIPDNRTLVFEEEDVLLRLMHRDSQLKPGFAGSPDWKKVESDLFAFVFDNHDGRLQRAVTKLKSVDQDDAVVEFLKPTRECVIGLENADDFLLRMFVACHDQIAGSTLFKLISGLRDRTVQTLGNTASRLSKGEEDGRACILGGQVTRGFRVVADGSSVRVEPVAGVKLADLLPFMLKNGL
jgi:hypothetical protein